MRVDMMTTIKETAIAYVSVASGMPKEEGGSVDEEARQREIALGGDGAGKAMIRMA